MSNVRIYLLGEVDIEVNGISVINKLSNKAIGLLCFLCTNKGKKFTRDKLSTYFWNDASIENARYNLRYSLWNLRKVFNTKDMDFFISSKDSCTINHNFDYSVDALHFDYLMKEFSKVENPLLTLEKCKNLYKGEFLQEFYLKNCPDFNDWIFFERAKYQKSYSQLLFTLSNMYSKNNMHEQSISMLEELLKINPYKEDIYLALMKEYLNAGNILASLTEYEKCEYILREELNIRPSENLTKFYKETILKHNILNSKESRNPLTIKLHSENSVTNSFHRNDIVINCYPIDKIKYFCISCIIDKIIDVYSPESLKSLENFILMDLLRIQGKILLINKDLQIQDNLTPHGEENRIYFSLERLFLHVEDIFPVNVFINDIANIDAISYNLLKLFIFKNPNSKIHIFIDGDKLSP